MNRKSQESVSHHRAVRTKEYVTIETNTPGIDCTDLMQLCLAWLLLSCSISAHSIAVRSRDVKIRGIAAPVRIYEAESQDAALDAAIETTDLCKRPVGPWWRGFKSRSTFLKIQKKEGETQARRP